MFWKPVKRVTHPAKFNPPILEAAWDLLKNDPPKTILDPFAGMGGIVGLRRYGYKGRYVLNEIEHEWLQAAPEGDFITKILGDWLLYNGPIVDCIVTSPTFGNRLADHFHSKDGSYRANYRNALGRQPSSGSSAIMQWGSAYRDFHFAAIGRMGASVVPGGRLVLDMSDHIRNHKRQRVCRWWRDTLRDFGWTLCDYRFVTVKRFRRGENYQVRVPYHLVTLWKRENT